MSGDVLTLRLRNDLAEIPRAAESVEAFLATAGADQSVVFKVNLCLDELLTNVISYGFRDGAAHQIEVRLTVAGPDLRVEVEDDAMAFNPLDAPPPDLDSSLETREVGGLGIHFVRESMDRVAYRRLGGRNRLTMQRRLREPADRATGGRGG